MADLIRILFVSDKVEPFSNGSALATLARELPEQLQRAGDYEMRIMMPRYGIISERRNRLHEVIRLSGTKIDMSARGETLKVKVASIPGIRLQVYFMDNNHYFKRKGIYMDKTGDLFDDNLERALFFARSTLETIRKLGWEPNLIHAFGWISGFVPLLVRSEYADDRLFRNTKTVFTPSQVAFETLVGHAFAEAESLNGTFNVTGKDPNAIGNTFADATILPPAARANDEDTPRFGESGANDLETARGVYAQILRGMAV